MVNIEPPKPEALERGGAVRSRAPVSENVLWD